MDRTFARLGCAVALAGALAWSPATAHHSFSAEFDTNLVGSIEGEVTRVSWRNPHVRYEVAVTGEDGETVTWELQSNATTGLVPLGWTRDGIEVGDRVTVEGNLARGGAPKIWIHWVSVEGGELYSARATGTGEVQRAEYDLGAPFSADPSRYPIDITGTWNNSHGFRVTVDDLEPKPVPLTEEGREIYEANLAGHDPGLRCVPVGMPRTFGAPRGMQVFDAGDFYLMVHEGGYQHRWVWMDGREAPENQSLSYTGFSTGRWEGRELVIETTHLLPGWLDGSGFPMSGEETRLEERWSFNDDESEIVRIMTIHDPLYTEPLTRTRGAIRADYAIQEEACDPDSFYQDLYREGRIEDYFADDGS